MAETRLLRLEVVVPERVERVLAAVLQARIEQEPDAEIVAFESSKVPGSDERNNDERS